jgi:hypothetical protein
MTTQSNVADRRDSYAPKVIPDLDFIYQLEQNATTFTMLDAKYAHNFQMQAAWRCPMSPRIPEVESYPDSSFKNKWIWGYSVGICHNTLVSSWQFKAQQHRGYNYHATLGHGLKFDVGALSMPRNYSTWSNNTVSPAPTPPVTLPALREENVQDNGGLYVGPGAANNLYRNDTNRGSTSIPEFYSSDPRPGHASGFPGDYLAEIHSYTQYGSSPADLVTPVGINVPEAKLSINTGVGNFKAPEQDITGIIGPVVPGATGNENYQDELFVLLNTLCEGNTAVTSQDQYRNFQKVYVLLWVV